MLRRCVVLSSVGVMVLAGALAATPALGQVAGQANLIVRITPVGDNRSTDATLISFGGTKTYTVSVQNNGPSHAAAVQVTATLPSGTRLSSIVSSCRTADGKFPCSLGDIVDGSTATTRFTISLPAPLDPYPTVCPPANMLGPTSVQISSTTPDTDPLNTRSASTINTVRPFADLAVTISGPATANQGDTVAYTVGVTNKGPCTSETVRVRSSVPRTGGGILFQSNSGDCTSAYPCRFGDLANGVSKTVTSTYTVDTLPSDINNANIANTVTVESVKPAVDSPTVTVTATDDLILSNNTATARTLVANSVGCSSAGGDLSIALVAVVLLASTINRRRRA